MVLMHYYETQMLLSCTVAGSENPFQQNDSNKLSRLLLNINGGLPRGCKLMIYVCDQQFYNIIMENHE